MRAVRAILALLLVAAAIAAIQRVAIPRFRCNLAKGQINRDVRRFGRTGNEYERQEKARQNVARCRECMELFPQDHHWYALLGANLRVLGEREEAIDAFRHAIALVERPEFYAQIAEIEFERGNNDAGRAALMKAATFEIFYIEMVSEPIRSETENAVMARYNKLRANLPK